MAALRAGSRSQGCHGTSLLYLVFSRGSHQPCFDGTSSQAHELAMNLSLSGILPFVSKPTWPSQHKSENQELFRMKRHKKCSFS